MKIYKSMITRELVKSRSKDVWLFGDNLDGKGYGGMAKEIRGEPNAVGIPTKRHPSMSPDSFFMDNDYDIVVMVVEAALKHAEELAIKLGGEVIVPAGIGQGWANLPQHAPKIWKYLKGRLGL